MAEHFNVVEQFGIDVFYEETMKQRLPKNVFKALKKTIAGTLTLSCPCRRRRADLPRHRAP